VREQRDSAFWIRRLHPFPLLGTYKEEEAICKDKGRMGIDALR
jgi:hypothetical protein